MKKILIFGCIALCNTMSFAQDAQKALNYMNVISTEFKSIQSATWDYTRSVAKNKGAKQVDKNRVELIQTISNSIAKVKKIGAYDGKTYFKDSTLAFLELQKIVIAQDYEKIMNMEEIAEQSYDLMEAYMLAQEMASEKLSASGERISEVERKFAGENNITLIEGEGDKISANLAKAGEMYDYYNPIYLIFFKSYKQEAYLMDALQKGDVSGMEQNKSMLAQTSQEGIDAINKVTAFKGDETLKKACLEMLTFYALESKKFQVFIDFQSTKDGFEKAKANMEAMKEKDRTQADVDTYNKLIKEFNNATMEYNNTNNELNNTRSKLLNNWNNTSSNFTNSHI